jgi:hypothetical protein
MKHPLFILISITVLGSLTLLAALQQPALPTTVPVAGQNDGPPWHDTLDIGNGVELEAAVRFSQPLVDPSTSQAVRAISFHMNFLYGVGLMTQVDYLQTHELTDSAAISVNIFGVDRNVVVEQRPPFDPLNYLVTIAPKTGFTWGTVEGALDLVITATPQ